MNFKQSIQKACAWVKEKARQCAAPVVAVTVTLATLGSARAEGEAGIMDVVSQASTVQQAVIGIVITGLVVSIGAALVLGIRRGR